MSLINLNQESFAELVSKGTVLVDFYAEWCGPCKMLGPVLQTFSNQREDVLVLKVNIDEHSELMESFKIMSVPTLMLYKDGKVVSTAHGFHSIDMLNSWIDKSN
jgi:thioredoxin 1